MQNAKKPTLALRPSQIAADAPGNATMPSVWPAKVWRRSTMNQPTAAAAIATAVPARNALTMKWNSNSCVKSAPRFQVRFAPLSASTVRPDPWE